MRLVEDPGGRRARSFADVADGYDYSRPSYPPAAVRWLLGPGPLDVLDLGAGTGKLTAVVEAEGHRVVAVEPLGPLRVKLAEALPGVEVIAGQAEEIPRPAGSADAVLVGQAFHWFEARAAVAEIAWVLRPGGRVGLLWPRGARWRPWWRARASGCSARWGSCGTAMPPWPAGRRAWPVGPRPTGFGSPDRAGAGRSTPADPNPSAPTSNLASC